MYRKKNIGILVANIGWSLEAKYFNKTLKKDTITPTIKEGDRPAVTSLCFMAFVDRTI